MSRLRRLSPYLWPVGLALCALGMIYGRFVLQASTAVSRAEEAAKRDEPAAAIRSYRDALRAYVPGSPFQRRALDGLAAQAAAARARGDTTLEKRSWEAMRVGLLGARSLYIPSRSRYLEATRHLAELGGGRDRSGAEVELAEVSARGNGPGRSVRPLGPAVASTLVSLLGFGMWVGAIALMIRRAVVAQARRAPPRTPSRYAVAVLPLLFLVGVALFLAGLRFA